MERERLLMALSGLVALAAGTHQAVRGVGGTRGVPQVSPAEPWLTDVDSEMRFYSAWYASAGLLSLRLARHDVPPAAARALGATWLAAGAARTWGARQVGRPSPLFQALGVAELGLGAALLAVPRRPQGA